MFRRFVQLKKAPALFNLYKTRMSVSVLPESASNPKTEGSECPTPSNDGTNSMKRGAEDADVETKSNKKAKFNEDGERIYYVKKKVALMMVYSGKGYLGMQRNPDAKTIEGDLLESLVKSQVCTGEHIKAPGGWMKFQRAARTDKGVSAVGQVVSSLINVDDALEKINSFLPPQIRVLDIVRTTKGFDSKQACDARTYSYTLPTFAFAPIDQTTNEDYRVTDEILENVNELLGLYKGTHNFFNFTSGKKHSDRSAFRYIMEFKIGKPFVRDGLELAVITVKGQSFMLHQIRKMIGLVIAIQRGLADKGAIESAWGSVRRDIPMAPGLGLMLEKVHYDWYNRKFGKDGIHDKIDWDHYKDKVDQFKEEFIFPTVINTEREEKSMLKWLASLHLHHFGDVKDPTELVRNQNSGVIGAHNLVQIERAAAKEDQDTANDDKSDGAADSSESSVKIDTEEESKEIGQNDNVGGEVEENDSS